MTPTTTPRASAARDRLTRTDGDPIRTLVVDDEPTIGELLSTALRYEGWDVRTATTGVQAIKAAKAWEPDVILLDVMLPDLSGLEVLHRVRATHPYVPVLFLTAKDAVEDRVAGLTAGGDDYVTKPFSLEEVVARVRSLLRRAGATSAREDAVLQVGDLTLDEDSHEVTRAGQDVHLTATEFELLRYFMRNPRRVLSKAQILDRVWQYDFGGQANIVELYVSYLRRKIDKGHEPMLHTLRGVGYVLKPAPGAQG
ncbi:response regulator transcription factor [Isoptericola sp. b441]|uniref:Response regulator transcription factor n=1 Tax=Actinotalea lenta TaxID=3064654 RepID=A0ABT9D6T6_9CELL|nr:MULTISPECIES: response regulator transcription factor [unclassified Isoptericola]MDO8106544.1 response regulator transcription factor [Isoptericola sp. b441]MDO8121748.1 response regulator transcription factor [Isoptericola sp. b490]